VNAARWQQIKAAFNVVLEVEPEQRSGCIEKIAAADLELFRALETLLAAHAKDGDDFLNIPAAVLEPLDEPSRESSRVGTRVGPYELVRKLGSGGMGEVYLARRADQEFEQRVAIKLVPLGEDSTAVLKRFKTERQILATLEHPNIAKLLDGGRTAEGQPYFVMEYVPGLPITEYCELHEVPLRHRVELFLQACDGVQHAHQNAIIHRDLKPANILVIEIDGKPVPRIIDFGIAKAANVNFTVQTLLTRAGQFVGTPGYMSPEQADPNCKNIDSRTDVYSLGVIFYVLLTGAQPFETADRQLPPLDQWLECLRNEEPPRPSDRVGAGAEQLRGDLDGISLKALARDRERRYATSSEFAADLRRYLNDEPVFARPVSASYQLRRFVRRHRIAAALMLAMTAASILVLGAAVVALRHEHAAEEQAAQALRAEEKARESQARLLTQVARERLKDANVAGAQEVMLEVLANAKLAKVPGTTAVSTFQEIRAADQQIAVLSGHDDSVYAATYSPDGMRIVTTSEDKTARVWDAATGVELAILRGHAGAIYGAAYSADGSRIATASADKTARIWDATTGRQIAVLDGHTDRVLAIAFSPDGTRIATASADRTARIWDARSAAQVTVLAGHTEKVTAVAYAPDGGHVVTVSTDGSARIWDARTGKQVAALADQHGKYICAAYSPDGNAIVTGSSDKTVRIWNARTGAQLAVLLGHENLVVSVAYSPDGAQIVSSSFDDSARIWDAKTGKSLAVLAGHRAPVSWAAYSPDGTHVVTASNDKTARIWDLRPHDQIAVFAGHAGRVNAAAFSPDGTRIAGAAEDRTARIWDMQSGHEALSLVGHGEPLWSVVYAPDGKTIATASADNTAQIWDAATGAKLKLLAGHLDPVVCVAYAPDSSRVVTASQDQTARIWDLRSGAQLALLTGHRSRVSSAEYSPDGTRIVTASYDGTARVWDAGSGAQLASLRAPSGWFQYAGYSPDGTRIITASSDGTARIWDARTGKQLLLLSGHRGTVNWAAYSPDGARVVTASSDKTARIWNGNTGEQLEVIAGHADEVMTAAYSSDGKRIVTASKDGTVRVWNAGIRSGVAEQILWSEAAEFESLPEAERSEWGLPLSVAVWDRAPADSACAKAAGAFYDPDRLARGTTSAGIAVDVARSACATEIAQTDYPPHAEYEMGRVFAAEGNAPAATQRFAAAAARGYRAAQIDAADLLVSPSARIQDPASAINLYRRAWQAGVLIAAYKLGHLYEYGVVAASGTRQGAPSVQDGVRAWQWYTAGADAGEPTALARFAQREENDALMAKSSAQRDANLLHAFEFYAAAAKRAREEDWPDEVWKHWRYRRATLARVLAQDSMMRQVADAYAGILETSAASR